MHMAKYLKNIKHIHIIFSNKKLKKNVLTCILDFNN